MATNLGKPVRLRNDGGAPLQLETGGAVASLGVSANGVISVGSGLQFPAVQVASGNANTLDDYAEGAWTPVYEGTSGTEGSTAYSVQRGRFTKVGRLVFASGEITLTNKGSWAGAVRFRGLPFQNIGATEICFGSVIMGNVDLAADERYCSIRGTGGNNSEFFIDKTRDNLDREVLSTAAVNNDSSFTFSFVYTTA
jgi:hypothetical protein